MEQGKSSLNPDAASFIPTHKREATDENKYSELTTEVSLKSGDETTRSFSPTEGHCGSGKHFQADTSDSDVHEIGGHLIGSEVTKKGHDNLSDQAGQQYINQGSQFDLDYLAFLFPDVSENFLANVYSINGGDVEESVDMLKQLECPIGQPESSNTGEDLEGNVIAECSSLKPEIIHSSKGGASSRDP